jgi:phage-related minor tail protein
MGIQQPQWMYDWSEKELLQRAQGALAGSDEYERCMRIVEIKQAKTNIELLLTAQDLSREQLSVDRESIRLSEELLKSNQEASESAEQNAKFLNDATKELARSTSSLNRATWILAVFTGIQVIIAILTFYLTKAK